MISKQSKSMQTTLCNLCPRNCQIDRNSRTGVCGEGNVIRASRASLHMWEEPCISGTKGSGTVFFSGCVLHCVFCQNSQISGGNVGKSLNEMELSDVFLRLQEAGANNINLVTPTHFVPQIIKALEMSKKHGLVIPIVYNTGSYEEVSTIKMLDGLVDVYLPDMKFYSKELSQRYCHAENYFDVAANAIEEMVRQCHTITFASNSSICEADMMTKGVIVRHLLMPGCLADSKRIVKYLYEKYQDTIYISLMNQYTPMPSIGEKYPELATKVSAKEYDELVDYAIELGVENGFIQEGETALESFIPDFNETGYL